MSKISEEKITKIKEEILSVLYEKSPKALFTKNIADLVIRDITFTQKLLLELEKKNLVSQVSKNSKGQDYLARKRWKLNPKVYSTYQKLV
ncbi:MAG: hypothetical protein HYS32_01755 [Candidatus Woesearchaeota archaeon]|nr:MAG: hypothetical protein HYS32_01755 [Candidatus Woesearchaeota archaeon]